MSQSSEPAGTEGEKLAVLHQVAGIEVAFLNILHRQRGRLCHQSGVLRPRAMKNPVSCMSFDSWPFAPRHTVQACACPYLLQ